MNYFFVNVLINNLKKMIIEMSTQPRPQTAKPRTKFSSKGRFGTNYMLVKDDVGRSKPFTHCLPKQDHYYGTPIPRDAEDAQ